MLPTSERRVIEFRAWHETKKIMLEANRVQSFWEFNITPFGNVYKEGVLQPIILLQYTGKRDRNFKKIFEGDIVKSITGMKYIVGFENGGFTLELPDGRIANFFTEMDYWGEDGALTIIGNMFKHKNLLETN